MKVKQFVPKRRQRPAKGTGKPLPLWGRVGCILVIAVAIGLILSLVLFLSEPATAYASAELQLTFDGAAEGKAPDGYAFQVDDLTSDEVIREALEESGLADAYTPEQIRASLVVTGSYPKDILEQTMSYDSLLNFAARRDLTTDRFYPTLFQVTLYSDFDGKLQREKLKELVENLLIVYRDHFVTRNVQGLPVNGSSTELPLSAYDYPQQLQLLQLRLDRLSAYASLLYRRDPAFRSSGSSFNDVAAELNSLADNSLSRLNAEVALYAITKDKNRLSTQYRYMLERLANRLTERRLQLGKLDELIASYEKNMVIYVSTSESLEKIGGNSSNIYDSLVTLRRELAESNTELSSRISTYALKLYDLTGEEYVPELPEIGPVGEPLETGEPLEGTEEAGESAYAVPRSETTVSTVEPITISEEERKRKRAAVEADIDELLKDYDEIKTDFSEMVKAWNESKLNEDSILVSSAHYSTKKLISGSFIFTVIRTVGPIFMLAVIACLVMIIVEKRREGKAR